LKPWETLGEARMPDGSQLVLRRRDTEYVIRADSYDLMVSRMHGSEEALADIAMGGRPTVRDVLVGGLGMGYTLRAALDRLPPGGSVVVAELIPDVVEWNRGPLAHLAGEPLADPRVRVEIGDVASVVREGDGRFDAIMLDVDNGPGALTQRANGWLYSAAGLAAIHRALRPRGVLAVWSVSEAGSGFERALTRAGFVPRRQEVPSRPGARGRGFVVYSGSKRAGSRPAQSPRAPARRSRASGRGGERS
jgi:spermidine synthase